MFLLWRLLAFPLRGFVERLGVVRWGREREVRLYDGPLAELSALSGVIGRLAAESFEKEELKARYVTDLVEAQENTRRQLARELHDGALQSSVAAIKRIQLARRDAPDAGGPAASHLATAEEAAQSAAAEIRDYCEALSPSWARLGLVGALEETAGRLTRAHEGVQIDVDAAPGLERETADFGEDRVTALARILQEAASNSVRHGGAGLIQVELRRDGDLLCLSVQDDGSGFDADGLVDGYEGLRAAGRRGLSNMFERSRLLGGELRLVSRPGEGCRVEVTLPQGVAVGVRLRLHRSEDPENGEFTTAMRSTNPQIVQVWPTTERNTFVLCGASEGVASVTVLVEAQDDRTIAVVVDPPLRVTP
jgi:signal transduction histidine kinase